MSRIRGRDTQPELRIRRALHKLGWRYRVNWKGPGGRIDIAFPRMRVAVLIDGCFWHACPLHGVQPKSNSEFWSRKLAANRSRDRRHARALRAASWRVLRYWEHAIRDDADRVAATIHGILLDRKRDLVEHPSTHRIGR